MGKNTSVVIGEEQETFIRRRIEAGRFGSVSDAIREGLALLEERELRIERLRRLIDEGEASGDPQPIDFDSFLKDRAEWFSKSA